MNDAGERSAEDGDDRSSVPSDESRDEGGPSEVVPPEQRPRRWRTITDPPRA